MYVYCIKDEGNEREREIAVRRFSPSFHTQQCKYTYIATKVRVTFVVIHRVPLLGFP